MRIIDMHCDTLLKAWRNSKASLYDGDLSVNIKLLKENQSMVQFFAMYISRVEMETMDPGDIIKELYGYYSEQMKENEDIIRPAHSVADIERNRKDGILSAFLTIEDGVFMDENHDRIREVYDMGVRLITLLWNFENSIGFPCRDDRKENLKGLKPFGIEAVRKMNEMGIIIDVSHLSEGGFYDVAEYSRKPFVASHSCVKSLCNHRRNLTDNQLKTLGNTGGVIGVNFEGSFLEEGSNGATYDSIIKHLVYIKNKAGIDAVGFGSDFDGIRYNGELINYNGFTELIRRMEKRFTYDEIDKICNLNILRVMKEVLGE